MLLALQDVIESASGLVTIDDEEMREFINADVETIKEMEYYKHQKTRLVQEVSAHDNTLIICV